MTCTLRYGLWLVALFWSCCLQAAHTEVSLQLSHREARSGETIFAAIRLQMDPTWHTYWANGGDSGGPTLVEWELPDGIEAGPLQWPLPQRTEESGLVSYIYENEVLLIAPIQISATVKPGEKTLKAQVRWLECAALCIPARDEVESTIVVGNTSQSSPHAAAIAEWQGRVPQPNPALKISGTWQGSITNDSRELSITFAGFEGRGQPDFYPSPNAAYKVSAQSTLQSDGRLIKRVEKLKGEWPTTATGLAVFTQGQERRAFAVTVPLASVGEILNSEPPKRNSAYPFYWILCLAFIGGLILNIMPCVLPVIALKILGFVQQSTQSPRDVRKLGLVYAAGVWVSFLLLAGLVIAVKQAGGAAVWGMQFQNPTFLVIMTVLVTLVALNLFGVFEVLLGGNALGAANNLASKEGAMGAFFNGVLATALATPCTAPYLGFALGFAFAGSPSVIIAVFSMVAFGLAAPYVLLSWNPKWLKFLPKPGAWMERFKLLMGFPMLATAFWLLSLTGPRFGTEGVLWLSLFLVLLSLAAWVYGEFVQRNSARPTIARLVAITILIASYLLLLEGRLHWRQRPQRQSSPQNSSNILKHGLQKWTSKAVSDARAEGRPVLIDFTADWCLTCQIFSKTAIENEAVQKRLKELNAAVFIGDFTDQDPLIAAEILRHGRAGVPLVLVYPGDLTSPAILLPETLTPSALLKVLQTLGK